MASRTEPRAEFLRGDYRARLAAGPGDLARALALRRVAFRGGTADDADAFDAAASHLLVEGRWDGRLVACCRFMLLASGGEIATSYAAQFYDLTRLAAYPAPMLELGRFCLASDLRDPDVPRLAWGALAAFAAPRDVALIFGCSSFAGTDARRHAAAFALLAARHVAPGRWRPGVKAPEVVRFADGAAPADPRAGPLAMPPLLRVYLGLGGWVSDHAVIDRDLGTLHVFTALERVALPAVRARSLRDGVTPAGAER